MKSVAAFVLVTALFFAANAAAGWAAVGLGTLLPASLKDEPLAWLVVGLVSVGIGIWVAALGVKVISRSRG